MREKSLRREDEIGNLFPVSGVYSGSMTERLALYYFISLVLLTVIGSQLLPGKLWGLSLLKDYSIAVPLLYLISAFSFLFLAVRTKAPLLISGLSEKIIRLRTIQVAVISLLASLIPLVFIIKCPLMGDGNGFIYSAYPHFSFNEIINTHSPFISAVTTQAWNILQLLIGSEIPLNETTGSDLFLVWSVIGSISAFVFVFFLLLMAINLSKQWRTFPLLTIAVLSSGTMAIYSGFIEVTVVCLSVLTVYLFLVLGKLDGKGFPWMIFSVFFLDLGLHISAVALLPSLFLLVFLKRKELLKKPVLALISILLPAALFYFLLSPLIKPGVFFTQLFSGKNVIDLSQGVEAKAPYGIFSGIHALEFLNVLLLHNPLNLFWSAWILYAGISGWKKWVRDSPTLFLIAVLGGYAGMLVVFHPLLGMMRDWDIFSPLGLLLPFAAFRLWEVTVPETLHPRTASISAILLPLGFMHLLLWTATLHSRERLITRLFNYAQEERYMSERGKINLASNLALYCQNNGYFPDYFIELFRKDDIFRRFLFFRMAEKEKYFDLALNMAEKWKKNLSPTDYNLISKISFQKGEMEDFIYYLRLSTNKMPLDQILTSSALSLVQYYKSINRTDAATYYSTFIFKEDLIRENPALASLLEQWKKNGCYDDSVNALREVASQHIFNNGLALLNKGNLPAAEQEVIAAGRLGFDSERIKRGLDIIRSRLYQSK